MYTYELNNYISFAEFTSAVTVAQQDFSCVKVRLASRSSASYVSSLVFALVCCDGFVIIAEDGLHACVSYSWPAVINVA